MKDLLRKILPVSLWASLASLKRQTNLLKASIRIILSLPVKKKLPKIRFEVHLAEHCNLNCAGCNHFSPIAEPDLADINEFTRDCQRMAELFNHDCERIYLMGGEPLLHPDIIAFMTTARDFFPSTRIVIYTNGILLAGKESNFWEACRDNNIGIMISTYPIKLDLETIHAQAKKYNVNLMWTSAPEGALKDASFIVSPIDSKGTGNIMKSFAYCYEANNCITLKHGKLFTCVFAAHVHHFSRKFGINIPITAADYVDIYTEQDANAILEKLAKPIPACKYCSGGRFTKSSRKIAWHKSQQDIHEWL